MDISELLQEAKPLYFKRKKRNEFIKKSMYVILPIVFCSFFKFILLNFVKKSYYTIV